MGLDKIGGLDNTVGFDPLKFQIQILSTWVLSGFGN